MGTESGAGCPLTSTDVALEAALLALIDRPGTVCPSEAARRVDPDDWRALMDPARSAARRLVDAGVAEITQGGVVVDLSRVTGPIRVGRARSAT